MATSSARVEGDNPYLQPRKCCDIVMKGGITSGVVYPLAVCELAQTYQFKHIGGCRGRALARRRLCRA
jgi:hypothetical protein